MTDPNVLREMIAKWKAENKEKPRDLDFEMLCQISGVIKEESVVKIARNPLDENHDWIPDTVCYNVGKASVDDEGRLVLSIRKDKTEFSVGKLKDFINSPKTTTPSNFSCIMAQISETKTVQLTDIYSHALVKDSWGGMPFDLVLAYYEED